MSLFDNVKPEEFLLFVCNFNMTLTVSGTLEAGAKYQYPCTLFRREALCQFESLTYDVEITETLNVDYITRVLAQYFSPANLLSNQNRAMRCGMKNCVS